MYEFTKDCMLNIEEIDNEHRRLFQMINEAVAMIEQSDDVTYIANSLISNLKEYASTHFAHEEAYMESIHDPELSLSSKVCKFLLFFGAVRNDRLFEPYNQLIKWQFLAIAVSFIQKQHIMFF